MGATNEYTIRWHMKNTEPSIFHLSEREWVQVRAALVFWRRVVATSRTHPSRTIAVEPLFTRYDPLSAEELDRLIEGLPEVLYLGVDDIARTAGVTRNTADRRLKAEGIKPALVHGKVTLYRIDDAARMLSKYDV